MEPAKIGGVTIQYATAHNAKYIKDNKIELEVIQVMSGDVIQKFIKLLKKRQKPNFH